MFFLLFFAKKYLIMLAYASIYEITIIRNYAGIIRQPLCWKRVYSFTGFCNILHEADTHAYLGVIDLCITLGHMAVLGTFNPITAII